MTAALLKLGLPQGQTGASPFRANAATNDPAPPGAVWSTLLDGRICVMGSASPNGVTTTVDGLNGEGTCLEAFSH